MSSLIERIMHGIWHDCGLLAIRHAAGQFEDTGMLARVSLGYREFFGKIPTLFTLPGSNRILPGTDAGRRERSKFAPAMPESYYSRIYIVERTFLFRNVPRKAGTYLVSHLPRQRVFVGFCK